MFPSCAQGTGAHPPARRLTFSLFLLELASLAIANPTARHARCRPPNVTPASSEDLADALTFALRYSGRKRTHDAGEITAAIVAKRLAEHLERSGFVVMKKPPIGGGAAIGRGHTGDDAAMATQRGPLAGHGGRRGADADARSRRRGLRRGSPAFG